MVLCPHPHTLAVGVGGMWDAWAEITDMLKVLSLEIFSRRSCIRGAAYRKTSRLQRCERTSTSSPRRSGPNTCMPSWVAIAVLGRVRGRCCWCCANATPRPQTPLLRELAGTKRSPMPSDLGTPDDEPLKSTVAQLRVRGPKCRATARILKKKRQYLPLVMSATHINSLHYNGA